MKEKEVCKKCPKRNVCVELIDIEYPCPSRLDKIPIDEARDIQRNIVRIIVRVKREYFDEANQKVLKLVSENNWL